MSGQIIPFQGHRGSHRAAPPVPSLERQVARIADLVEELEGLTRNARTVPATTLARAQLTLMRAHRLLRPFEAAAKQEGEKEEGEPQPEIDRALLERHYREVNPNK